MIQRMQIPQRLQAARKMQNNQSIMQISENKDGSGKGIVQDTEKQR